MCGIIGLASQNGVSLVEFREACNMLRHRGPDDEGYLAVSRHAVFNCSGSDTIERLKRSLLPLDQVDTRDLMLLLGFRRLSIIDLSESGHQPMEYGDGNLWIIFNGEIYNYIELRDELKRDGFTFKSDSDTEVILAAYQKWGYDSLKKFNGMWGFCIWDRKKNILFCSRDRFGVKPFYYFFDGKMFAFASEIKALVALPSVRKGAEKSSVLSYLYFGIHDYTDTTFFSGIKQLLPGNYLVFNLDSKTLDIKPYYNLRFNPELGHYDLEKARLYRDQFLFLFEDAINLRLRSDVRVGACLSGGLDSSSIVGMIDRLLKRQSAQSSAVGSKLSTFTADYHETSISEKKYVDMMLNATISEGHFVYPDIYSLRADLDKLIYCQDEPFGSLSIYAQHCVMRLAKEAGVKVLLDGQGGDELLAGYIDKHVPVFLAHVLRERRILNFLEERNLWKTSYLARTAFLFVPRTVQMTYLLQPNKPYFASFSNGIKEILNDYLTKEYARTSLNENLLHEVKVRLPRLLKYEDRNSMAFGIESRLPFLDYRLVEFVMNLPACYKIHNGYSKWLLRDVASNFVPAGVRNRKDKVGFAIPQKKWVRELSELWRKDLLEQKFVSSFLSEYVNLKKVLEDYAILVDRERQASRKGILWRIISLGLWGKAFLA